MVDKSRFADKEAYFVPEGLEKSFTYHEFMRMSQNTYKLMMGAGFPPEHARGVLPMHVHTSLVMGLDLREFTRMMGNRTCWIAQGSYWRPVIDQFQKQLLMWLGREVCDYIFNPPCERTNPHCIMPDEAEHRLAGESPYKPCPKYTEEIRKVSSQKR